MKDSRFVLLRNKEDLNDEQKQILENIYQSSKKLKLAHLLKEEFREIFENEISIVSAEEKLNSWIQKAKQLSSKYFDTFTTTLLNWKTSILNYFKERLSNGFAEGINNKIKLIKRTAFGFNNFFHFRLRVISEFNYTF